MSLSHFRELDNIDGSMKLLYLKHFFREVENSDQCASQELFKEWEGVR